MAMICVNGCRECDGCGACDVKNSSTICAWCGEPISQNENHYNFDGDIVHYDCMRDYVQENFLVIML